MRASVARGAVRRRVQPQSNVGLALAVIALTALAGCGSSTPSASQLKSQILSSVAKSTGLPTSQLRHCKHQVVWGAATFNIDGTTVGATTGTSCPYAFSLNGVPWVKYYGPTGCYGRYFKMDYEGHVDFHYSPRDAYLVWAQQVYKFPRGPVLVGGRLVFDGRFPDHHIVVTVACPAPPASTPRVVPASG